MKIAVWDTYVKRDDGGIMHFDILVPSNVTDEKVVFDYGKHYLKTKMIKVGSLTANECRICHIEAATEAMKVDIDRVGYSIIEMENCN